ncbi:MAG: tyrosine decarboxylase MfnA [Candidatus Thermoplasmatota archaeon]
MTEAFPETGGDIDELMEVIRSAEDKDVNFSSGKIFGSMCTEPLDIAKKVHSRFMESNLGNPGLYQGTKELEEDVHGAVASLINAGEAEALSVGGGTEGNIIGLWRAREKSGKDKVLLPQSSHFSFEKACSMLDMRPEYISLTDRYTMDLDELEEKLDDETAAVVAIAGTTEHGAVDPIKKISELTEDVHLHVDAAFGGFVIPFLDELDHDLPSFDFEIDGVDSLVLDPHKMGMSPVPLGLFYSRNDNEITIDSPYLTGEHQKGIRGTRASASIPAFWITLNYLGKKGYKNMISQCMQRTYYLLDRMEEENFSPVVDPSMNIASFKHEDPKKIVRKMAEKGFNLSRAVTPPGLRFVVMPHVSMESIDEVVKHLGDLK